MYILHAVWIHRGVKSKIKACGSPHVSTEPMNFSYTSTVISYQFLACGFVIGRFFWCACGELDVGSEGMWKLTARGMVADRVPQSLKFDLEVWNEAYWLVLPYLNDDEMALYSTLATIWNILRYKRSYRAGCETIKLFIAFCAATLPLVFWANGHVNLQLWWHESRRKTPAARRK